MYPENPEGTQVIEGSMNMGYIFDTARNRTHNLFRPKREPIPLGHSDGHIIPYSLPALPHTFHHPIIPTLTLEMPKPSRSATSYRISHTLNSQKATQILTVICNRHISFYFENVAFLHAKLGSDVCPRVDNQTSGETLQDLTRPLVEKLAISQLSTHGNWSELLVVGCLSTPTSWD